MTEALVWILLGVAFVLVAIASLSAPVLIVAFFIVLLGLGLLELPVLPRRGERHR